MQIVKIAGINGLGKTKGCENAPVEILNALGEIGSSEKGKIIDKKLLEIEEVHISNNVEEANELIYENAKEFFEEQNRNFFIGGDHSISYSLVRAFNDVFRDGFLIIFDAHADCMKVGKEPSHEEWLRGIIEKGFLKENIVLVGVRNIWPEEKAFLEEKKVMVVEMKQIQENIGEVCDLLMEKARNKEALYISIDIDVVDPAYARGTGYLEPGGLSSRELIYFLQRLVLLKNFKAADIVEINPNKDRETAKLGAKLLAELI